jgi:acyl-CoA-binding protein
MNIEELNTEQLDKAFKKAYNSVRETDYKFKQDTLLYFYAYYKQATKENNHNLDRDSTDGEKLVNAFKINALFQVRRFSERECKIKYIELAIKYLGDDFLKDIES